MTPEQARAVLDGLIDDLTDDERTAQAFAEIVVQEAQRRAGGHPTPQARMAASGIAARNGHVYGAAGTIVTGRGGSVPLGQIIFGAEFGSSVWTQFGPRQSRGAWLFPAGQDQKSVDRLEDEYVAPLIDRAI